MAQKKTLSFKVFLTNEGVNEVRRFSVEHHILLSLERFKEELQAVFPILRTHYFTVTWKGKQNCNYFYVQITGIVN
jgi:hypothetical protein